MTLQQLFRSFDFDDIFPSVAVMYPNAKRHKKEFQEAYDLMCSIRPVMSKKNIRYQIIDDPDSGDSFFGAVDSNFKTTWEVLAGKNVCRAKGVDLSDEEMAANCLINTIFLATAPREFEASRRILIRA
ncbi:MAG: hypothetical protein IJ549_04450 [Prevotella sp.]|nr:hypothetical protein [Prevotella sp.]MBQ9652249.1 hypothetical protein [Prevotella sp.]